MADETIQNLNIDISVDDKASSQIKSLEESIDSLLKKFETLDTKSDSVSKSLGDFGDTGKSLDNVASKIDKMTKSAEKFSKTDISGNIEDQLDDIAQGYSKLELLQKSLEKQSEKSQGLVDKGKTIEDTALLNSLLQEYSKLEKVEREYAKQTAKSTPKQTKTAEKPTVSDKDFEAAYNAAKKYDNELSGLEAQSKALATQMAKMSAEGKNFGTSWENSAKRLNKIQGQIKSIEAEQAKAQLDTSDLSVPDVKLDAKQSENFTRIINQAEQATNQFGESAKKAAVSVDYLMSDAAKSDYLKKQLSEAERQLEKLASGGEGYENKDVKKLIDQIKTLRKELSKLEEQEKSADKQRGKSVKSVNNYHKGLRGLLNTAKQFLIFGAFFTIQRQISDAFSTGTNNAYQYSKAIGGELATSMDRLSTSAQYMKNGIGALTSELLIAFTPALELIADKLAEAGNALARFIAALQGKSTVLQAVKTYKEYAAATNSAAEATENARKANERSLASFDELNNITSAATSSMSGTDVTGTGEDYGNMFETIELDPENDKMAALGQKIRELTQDLDPLKVAILAVAAAFATWGIIKLVSGWLTGLSTPTQKISQGFSKMLKGIGSAANSIAILGGLALVINSLTDFIKVFADTGLSLGEVAGLLGITFGILIGTFSALLGVLKLLNPSWKDIAASVGILLSLTAVISQLTPLMDTLSNSGLSMGEMFGSIGAVLTLVTGLIAGMTVAAIALASNPLALVGMISLGASLTAVLWAMGEALPPILDALDDFIVKVAPYVIQAMQLIIDTIKDIPNFISKLGWAIDDFVSGVISAVTKLINFLISGIEYMINTLIIDSINALLGGINSLLPGDPIPLVGEVKIRRFNPKLFAEGGYPTTGQMFIARESGAELVGNIGGRTAVVNNDQIVQAVSMGVYNAVVDAFSTTSDNGNEQPVVVQIDGREVFRAVRSQNDSFRRRTGTSAF